MPTYAYANRIAWVDLSSGNISYESPDPGLFRDYVGGYGLGAYYLYTRQQPRVDPLGPDANLGFLAGPLTGTEAVTGNRFTVVGKSPKTGGFGDANCGGDFGPALKAAGLDAIFFKGVAAAPVYALVEEGEVSLHDAEPLWGKLCSETEDIIEQRHGKDVRAAVIGPAGERVSALACIINDKGRAAGRSGLGMVMGAKRLKAVAARPGDPVEVAKPQELEALKSKILKEHFNKDNGLYAFFHNTGTPGAILANVKSGDAPVMNWKGWDEHFKGAHKIEAPEHKKYRQRRYGCWKCPIACGAILEVSQGPYASRTHHPEYETLGSYGSMCCNDNLESIIKCNELCNEYGMDTISAGCTVAFAMECYENGLVSAEQCGCSLEWGDHAAVVRMTEAMATGEGFLGRVFGHGVAAALEQLPPEAREYAMHCGGEELPMHDPRCFPGLGVSYLADATPGRHTQGGSWNLEGGKSQRHLEDGGERIDYPEVVDRYRYSGKGEASRVMSVIKHVMNASGICMFGFMCMPNEALPRFLTLATGLGYDEKVVEKVGARIAALRMAFNMREGVVNLRDYAMPGRVLGHPPAAGGPLAGVSVDNETQLREHYIAMGWNPDTGLPQEDILRMLELDFALDALAVAPAGESLDC